MRDEKSFQLIITLLHSSKFNEFISMPLSSLSLARSLQQSIISLLLWGSHLLNDRLTSVGGRKENKRRKKSEREKNGYKKENVHLSPEWWDKIALLVLLQSWNSLFIHSTPTQANSVKSKSCWNLRHYSSFHSIRWCCHSFFLSVGIQSSYWVVTVDIPWLYFLLLLKFHSVWEMI